MRLENKVAFISGGARGMGAVEAKLFTQEGAKVVIGDILDEEGRQTEAEINEAGGECLFVHLDVTSEAEWQQAIDATVNRFGKLDILINNAGIFRSERVEEISGELWDQVMEINVKGVFLGTKAAIPEMRKAGRRLHHQYLLRCRPHRRCYLGSVHQFQGGSQAVHQVHGHSICARRHPGQLHSSRHHRHAHDCRNAARLVPRRPHQSHAPAPHRHIRRRGLRRPVPCFRRVLFRHRRRACNRRWADG